MTKACQRDPARALANLRPHHPSGSIQRPSEGNSRPGRRRTPRQYWQQQLRSKQTAASSSHTRSRRALPSLEPLVVSSPSEMACAAPGKVRMAPAATHALGSRTTTPVRAGAGEAHRRRTFGYSAVLTIEERRRRHTAAGTSTPASREPATREATQQATHQVETPQWIENPHRIHPEHHRHSRPVLESSACPTVTRLEHVRALGSLVVVVRKETPAGELALGTLNRKVTPAQRAEQIHHTSIGPRCNPNHPNWAVETAAANRFHVQGRPRQSSPVRT